MGRKSKRDKADPNIPNIRTFFASNIAALRDKKFADKSSVTAKNAALAEAAKTTLSQIQRILSGELGTSIDLIAFLAHALGVRPQDLLTPYFASQPKQALRTEAHPGLFKHRKAG